MNFILSIKILIVAFFMALLVGCGETSTDIASEGNSIKSATNSTLDSSKNSNYNQKKESIKKLKGYYVDSAIKGVNYSCGRYSDRTDREGKFYFEKGKDCQFTLSGVIIRRVSRDRLYDGVVVLEDNITVAQKLLSLDSDANYTNGIDILEEVAKARETRDILEGKSDISTVVSILRERIKNYRGKEFSYIETKEHLHNTKVKLGLIKDDNGTQESNNTKENNSTSEKKKSSGLDSNSSNTIPCLSGTFNSSGGCYKPIPYRDTSPPVIKLNGSSKVEVNVGEPYVELGATAKDTDNSKAEIEIKDINVTISGFVDTYVVGTYIITYSAEDKVGNKTEVTREVNVVGSNDNTEYKKLRFYPEKLTPSSYTLEQLSDSEFNRLTKKQKLKVANRLLNSLFFGYPLKVLQNKIDSAKFLSEIRKSLEINRVDKNYIESHILDNNYFYQYDATKTWAKPQVIAILTRFYVMDRLDRYFFNNWIAYILTQTIMFSPAEELSSTHTPDMANVYNRLVNMLSINAGMRYITYVHMMSQENWRRFRSPEDNGREMLEIYTFDTKDSDVPLAAKALQNWKLNRDSDTLEVGLNKNTTPVNLFETTVTTGEDFYRELVKSKAFQKGATKRLVDFFFPNKSEAKRELIANTIVESNPETWQDILEQILFSKEYLLHNNRALSAEERFYSFTKKTKFRVVRREFYSFRVALENMHQAVMKYKLGKLDRVPLDTLSFAYYHKYIREHLFMNLSYEMDELNRDSWKYDGWSDDFLAWENFEYDSSSDVKTLKSFVNYIFNAIIGRDAKSDEIALFKSHYIESRDGKELFKDEFNIFKSYSDKTKEAKEQLNRKKNMALGIMDYLSRLQESYELSEVE